MTFTIGNPPTPTSTTVRSRADHEDHVHFDAWEGSRIEATLQTCNLDVGCYDFTCEDMGSRTGAVINEQNHRAVEQ